MKVKITLTVDIDAASWTLNYGVEGAAAIRADVIAYVENAVVEQFRDMGVLTESRRPASRRSDWWASGAS